MSYSIPGTPDQRPERPTDEIVRTQSEITELLDVLDDEDCRAILVETGEEALSTKDIAERCDIPSSTAYRKVDRLVETGLLSDRIRICGSGSQTREYRRCIEHVEMGLGDDGIELHLVRSEPKQPIRPS